MRRWLLVAVAVVLLGAAALWLGGSERLLHPARYAVTGDTIVSPNLYAAAAARGAPTTPLAALRFPAGSGAVIAEAERATLWLDPPTALVLDQAAREPDADAPAPLADPALDPATVLTAARRIVGPAPQLARITWPTRRRPDWQVRFRGGAAMVDVADDSGVAARAKPDDPVTVPVASGWTAALLAGGGLAVAALALLAWIRRRRR